MKKAIMGLAALFLSLPLWAQLQFRSLEEVLAYADKNSLTAKAASLAEKAVEKDEQLFQSTLRPRLDLNTAADYNVIIPSLVVPDKLLGGAQDKYSTVQFGLPFSVTTALEFALPVIDPEKWEQLKVKRLEKQRALYNTGIQLENLHIQLAQAYFNAITAKKLLALSAESKSTAAQLLTVLEQRKKEGVLQPLDHNRAKQLLADIDNHTVTWNLLLAKSINALHQLLNIPATDSIILLEKRYTDWNLAGLTKSSLRPAYKAAQASWRIAEQSLLQSRKAALPRLSLQARYAYQWQVNKGQAIHFDMSTVGLKLGVPLFAGGFFKTSQKKAALLVEAARIQEQQSLAQLEKEQADWMAHYIASTNRQKSLQNKLDATSDNLRIARLSIGEGVMEFDDFHTVFQEWLRARMEYMQAESDGLFYQFLLTLKQSL